MDNLSNSLQANEPAAYSIFQHKEAGVGYEFHLLPEQVAYFHTLLVEEVENKLELVFDEHNPISYAQKQAYLKGRIDLLNEILNGGI